MKRTGLHDGRDDGLKPLQSIDIQGTAGFAQMLQGLSQTAFGGRELGQAYEVLLAMARDPDCLVVGTLSGAMTVAKMGLVLCAMIEHRLIHCLVCTGATMAHGLSEAIGGVHYKHDPAQSDEQLFEWGYNRVYDTLEMEANLVDAERVVSEVLSGMDTSRHTCSSEITRAIGKYLFEHDQMPSILGWAYHRQVPVYIPAFTDSELGLDVSTHWLRRSGAAERQGDLAEFFAPVPAFNPYLDLHDYARRMIEAKRRGIFTIGGGVPRNWAQQVGPFADIINMRLGTTIPVPQFRYGVRICPEPAHWGGLSGCSYSEGVSWGKFVSPDEGGRFAEVHCDATIAWPILIRGVLETLGKG